MSSVMTLLSAEHGVTELAKSDAEALTFARGLADDHGASLLAVVAAHGEVAQPLVDDIGRYGAEGVTVLVHDAFGTFAPAAIGAALAELIPLRQPHAVIASGVERTAEIMAHAAARSDLPLAANCVSAQADGDAQWQLTRVRWGGVLLEDARLQAPTALLTLAPHQISAAATANATSPAVERHQPTLDELALTGRVEEVATASAGISLATASVVISGGRGVGSAEGFSVLEELAGLLGGAVGCSRVATNNGWRSHNDQVGQTGTRVAPDLYVACGISGATQHWVGCMSAKKILAINTDADAPMVTRADYAALGDLHEILPAVVEEIRRRTSAA